MTQRQNLSSDKSSMRCRTIAHSFNIGSSSSKEHTTISQRRNTVNSDVGNSIQIFSTSQLLSTAGGIWSFLGQPVASQTKGSSKCHDICQRTESVYPCICDQVNHDTVAGCGSSVNNCSSRNPMAKSTYEDLKAMQKMALSASCGKAMSGTTFFKLRRWTTEVNFCAKDICMNVRERLGMGEKNLNSENCNISESTCVNEVPIVSEAFQKIPCAANVDSLTVDNNHYSVHESCLNQLIKSSTELPILLENQLSGQKAGYSVDSCFVYSKQREIQECDATIFESIKEDSICENTRISENHKHSNDKNSFGANTLDCQQRIILTTVTINKHAIAGGLAGTFVSLCLHPMDTVKTVLQSNGAKHSSFFETLRYIKTQRGVLGLYRGLTSKICSSAPISAIYTFTYESVKGYLLPSFPKEYYSFAHCIAGGCSSLATSFVFTPSECIKQHMQLSPEYRNCWSALVGCLKKGGFSTLYAGWGAVLCRNIPHSVIKFYAYESLKQSVLEFGSPSSQLTTCQTLLCGGLAGSTAAFFTTPFDVVKTRMQFQIPGTCGRYSSVIHALHEIMKQEGFLGLYRGLFPRLAMYISQGSIFFASYECLKAILNFELKDLLQR